MSGGFRCARLTTFGNFTYVLEFAILPSMPRDRLLGLSGGGADICVP